MIRSEHRRGYSAAAVSVWFHRLYSDLGFSGASSHSGRRTFITKAAKKIVEAGGSATGKSGAIGLALFATAFGLITAIPLVFSHVLFKAWINQFETKMKNAAQKLLLLIQNAKQSAGTGGAPKTGSDSSVAAPRR